MREFNMKKTKDDDLRSEYDLKKLGKGIRGKHLTAYKKGSNLVLLKPEIAKMFPTSAAVNKALRLWLKLSQKQNPVKRTPHRSAKKSQ